MSGQIISINEDVITIKPTILRDDILQSSDNIIIDFAYNGLPTNIKAINLVENKNVDNALNPVDVTKINEPDVGPGSEYNDEYEYVNDDNGDESVDKLHEILDSANIIFGDLISQDETIAEELSDDNRRYDIDKQLTDMLDGMFANTP